jgi:hypothetical protein
MVLANQGGFIEKRHVVDNVILIQEAIHSSKGCGGNNIIINIDMANTFDWVRHNFLFKVLQKFGFAEKFISWVACCIYIPWISPLVNGFPSTFFRSSKGLIQASLPSIVYPYEKLP